MTQVAVGRQIWNYWEIGDTGGHGGPPLLILHGWGRSGNEWVAMAKEISTWSGRTVYVLDLPGFGGSSLPAQAGLPQVKNIYEYSELVVNFCRYLGIEKMILAGHSLGGRVGIVMGADHPEMVEKLVLIDPAGVKPKSIKRTLLKWIAKAFGWIPTGWRQKIVGGMMDSDYKNSPALRQLYRAIVKDDLLKKLPEIGCPVELLWGEQDKILPLALTKVYRKYLKDVRPRVIWGADHDPHLSKYEQTLRVMQEVSE